MGKMFTNNERFWLLVLGGIAFLLIFWGAVFFLEAKGHNDRNWKAKMIISAYPDAKFVYFDPSENRMVIEIWGELSNGTDGACETAARLFHSLCSLDPEMILYVRGDWVPSLYNPIDFEWTTSLIANINDRHPIN